MDFQKRLFGEKEKAAERGKKREREREQGGVGEGKSKRRIGKETKTKDLLK